MNIINKNTFQNYYIKKNTHKKTIFIMKIGINQKLTI